MQTHLRDEPVIFYDHETGKLCGRQGQKARLLVQLGKVRSIMPDTYEIYPIEGYNSRKYTVEFDGTAYKCNCQFSRNGERSCSHIMAVELLKKGGKP